MHVRQTGVVGMRIKKKVSSDPKKRKEHVKENIHLFVLVVQYFLGGENPFVITFDHSLIPYFEFSISVAGLYILFMRLFPEGDIVSIHTVYCGVF